MRRRNYPRRNQQRHRGGSFRSFSGRRSPSSRSLNSETNWLPFSYTDDEKWKTFYANGRPRFQKSCILFCVVFFECDEKDVFWKESHSYIGLHHAEVKTLNRIVMEEKRYRSRARWVQLYLSYSPCGTCANEIILFTEKRPNCNVFIAFSCLYRHNKEQIHRDGLRLLDAEPRISIKDQPKNYATVKKPELELAVSNLPRVVPDVPQEITDNAWTVLNQRLTTGRINKPREITSTTNEAKGKPIQNRTKNYATAKKPELELAVSTLPSIVPDVPQEIRGNARSVLNKPREITSTTNKAKGQPMQVQPRGKKNDIGENGVFPSDSEVSNSSLFGPDQIRSDAISPPSTDRSQPQEQTVIDIPEPKEDHEQAVCPRNRRREMVAIIIFVVLISIAIVLLIVFGQWS